MKLDCVLTACTTNPLYMDFIPMFILAWNKLYPTIDVMIVLIAEEIPQHLTEYSSYIILFKPINGISDSFISQYIRMLYPCVLKNKNGVLITDIDMIPMNSTYYTHSIRLFADTKFVSYRDVLIDQRQLPMCYNVATPSVWSDIFKINNISDISNRLANVFSLCGYDNKHGGDGWYTDQLDLYKYVIEWNKTSSGLVVLNDTFTGYKRLDREDNFGYTTSDIHSEIYSDYHCLRPYVDNKKINDEIIDALPDKSCLSGENISTLCDVCVYDSNHLDSYPSLRLHANALILTSITPTKECVDKYYSFFVKTDYLEYFESKILPLITKKFVLISHNSSILSGLSETILESPYLVKWYGQNMIEQNKNKCICLPLGLENSHWNHVDFDFLQSIRHVRSYEKKSLLYFDTALPALISNGFCQSNYNTWSDYIKELSSHRFAICDTSIDSHRVWECLYVGCTPIMLSDNILCNHYHGILPILFVHDYAELTPDILSQSCFERCDDRVLSLRYWSKLIHE